MNFRFSAIVIACIVLLSGCIAGSPPQAINETPLTRIADIDPSGLFAADQNGRKLAFARSGLSLLDLESRSRQNLSTNTPVALAWSPQGTSLAAAFPAGDYETRLTIYSDQGESLHETLLPVALSQMTWSVRGDLLITGYALKIYSFGGNLRQVLYRVDADENIQKALADTTLKPATAKQMSPLMLSLQPVVFSPQGDELVFARFHDPPEFAPYLQLQYMNWESGEEKSLRKIPLQALQLFWRAAERSVEVMTQSGSFSLSLWPAEETSAAQLRVPFYRFVKGRLYHGETLLVDWGDENTRLQLLNDDRYLLAQQGRLYLGSGLRSVPHSAYSEKAWTMRRWLFEGLITSDEYLETSPGGSPMSRLLRLFGLIGTGLLLATTALAENCVECHQKETPAAVEQWQASIHAPEIDCSDCHGTDHEAILKGDAPVDAKVCGRCHEDAYHEHISSKHGRGLHSGWGCTRNLKSRDPRECRFCHEEGSTRPKTVVHCARFLTQTSEMGALGCNRCHQVENSCASCHTNHITDLATVRSPGTCATCHMGPDHPQWEMWQTSRHGVLFEAMGEVAGPTCQRCHMAEGSHNVSYGITMSPAMVQLPKEQHAVRRQEMVGLCMQCHARSFSERELKSADIILAQSLELVSEAEAVIRDLADRNLLVPSLQGRPEHPLRGQELVLDGQMLYEDISHVERLFFKMKKYDLAKTIKGAFHQNPTYTHWYGNAELKMTLVDIKAEAARLLQAGATTAAVKTASETGGDRSLRTLEEALQILKRKWERGAIDADEYSRSKQELFKRFPSE